jgi:hypothetical protein
MKASKVALIVVAGLSLAGCSQRHSLFMDPGQRDQASSGHGRELPPPPPKTERQ